MSCYDDLMESTPCKEQTFKTTNPGKTLTWQKIYIDAHLHKNKIIKVTLFKPTRYYIHLENTVQ